MIFKETSELLSNILRNFHTKVGWFASSESRGKRKSYAQHRPQDNEYFGNILGNVLVPERKGRALIVTAWIGRWHWWIVIYLWRRQQRHWKTAVQTPSPNASDREQSLYPITIFGMRANAYTWRKQYCSITMYRNVLDATCKQKFTNSYCCRLPTYTK